MSRQDKYRQALSAVIGITMESLEGGSMSKHTPGPWTENACEIQAQDGSPICEMLARPEDSGVNYPYSPVADSNARLIAAAPETLAVLVAARASISDALSPDPSTDWRDSLSDALGAIDAAIEDATKEEA